MSADLYTNVARATFVTVKLTLLVVLGIPDLDIAHWPLVFVVHEPALPLFQEPLTVAFATGPWLSS